MNQQNADFLKDRLFFLGFGDKLNKELERKIEAKQDKFTLNITAEFGKEASKKDIDYAIDVTKSKKEDMYFLNSYTATLKNDEPEKERTQKFYLNNGSGVTAKEAFNLLEGRAVYKKNLENRDGEKYEAWLQLNLAQKDDNGNFKQQQYHQKWNYDLERSLHKHPIKELSDATQTSELLKSLQKGNLQQVSYTVDNREAKWFVEANPRERNVNVYDENMRKQFQGIKEYKGEKSAAKQGQEESNDQKQKTKSVSNDNAEEGIQKSKGKKVSV